MAPNEKPVTLQQFVAEWFVEDPARYERLTRKPIKQHAEARRVGPRLVETKDRPYVVITAVLLVPPPTTDTVTTMLRGGADKDERSSTYLARLIEAAEREDQEANRIFELESRIRQLEELALEVADCLDRTESTIEDACVRASQSPASRALADSIRGVYAAARMPLPPGRVGERRHARSVRSLIDASKVDARLERDRVNKALLERSADVAAQLLARLPDM